MPCKGQNERAVSVCSPPPLSIFRFFHLPGAQASSSSSFPPQPSKSFTKSWEQKGRPTVLDNSQGPAPDSHLQHSREGGEMLMVLPCHPQEPREHNDAPRSHQPGLLFFAHSVLLNSVPRVRADSVEERVSHISPWNQGLLPTGSSPENEDPGGVMGTQKHLQIRAHPANCCVSQGRDTLGAA